jgi:invasion protein IalB
MRILDIRLAFAVALVATAGQPAGAQESTSATYGDWVVRCERDTSAPEKKTCQMAQVTQVQVQGKSIPFSRVAVKPPVSGQPVGLEAQFPVNVSLRAPVVIRTQDADPGFAAPFDHCLPAGCFAEFEVKDELFKKLRAADGAGKVSFKDAAGRDVVLPISFKGFREAFDALAKTAD